MSGQVMSGHISLHQRRSGQPAQVTFFSRLCQTASCQVKVRSGPGQVTSGQEKVRPGLAYRVQVKVKTSSNQVRSCNVRTGHVRSGQVMSGQV